MNAMDAGFSFAILASAPSSLPASRGGLGYANTGTGLAVEFDFSREMGDPNANHIGINTGGSVKSVGTASPPFPMTNGSTVFVWIDFAASSLSVFVSLGEEKPSTPALQQQGVDICQALRPPPLTSASRKFFVGFTAQSNGQKTGIFIQDWCFTTGKRLGASTGFRGVQPRGCCKRAI